MPDQITIAYVQEYKDTVALLMQQEGSRFRGAVTTGSHVGKAASVVEQFGPVAAVKRVHRHQDTPLLDVPQDKRWVFPEDYEWASLIDDQDRLRMIIDPTGPYARNGANAMARGQDDEIIPAFFGDAKVGENGDETESFSTADHQVGVNVGGTASSLNVAKLQDAFRRHIAANKGDIMEPMYCAISSFEHDALLKELQTTSREFNGGQPILVDGRIKRFMGFDFILSERLEILAGNRRIPTWVKSGMYLGFWQDTKAQISERADKSYAWQVYLCQTIGATRLEAGKVIEIQVDDQI